VLSLDKENDTDQYDISKQKKLYIQTLRQIIEDESAIDFESLGQNKIDRIKKMNALVDEIDHLITNSYDLRCTQYFHYQYYSRL
jgi:F0F1-type ATP synthase membrane subunit b/b'